MENQVFGKKTSNNQPHRLDRFVMPRDTFANIRARSVRRQELIDNWNVKNRYRKNYISYLSDAFGINTCKGTPKLPEEEFCVQPWPCLPRKQSFLSSADSILDLPLYRYNLFAENLDWSNNNVLVAALGKTYHRFHWKTQRILGQGIAQDVINCCKFSPDGNLLLLGTNKIAVEIHDDHWGKKVMEVCCQCQQLENENCTITSMDWSPTGNSFIIGCGRGAISVFHRNGERLKRWRSKTREVILSTKISPDARFVAVTAMNSRVVHILHWPYLEYHSSLDANWRVKSIVWHPWRSALLGVGVVTPNFKTAIIIWDAPSGRLRETCLGFYNFYCLDAMLFSHRTGELVLCLWDQENFTNSWRTTEAQLIVMSDPYSVVDQSGHSRDSISHVHAMVFSPCGTKLATATRDEDLIIWNFLPEDNKKVTRPRRFSSIPSYLDETTQGFVLR